VEVQKPADNEPLVVHSTLPGTPAHRAQIHPGDVIIAIDGVDTKTLQLKDAVQLMRGVAGSEVHVRMGGLEDRRKS